MLVSLRKANMLQLVADLLMLCAAGTGSGGQYNQGGQGYGQDSTTGEQCAIRVRPGLKSSDDKHPLSPWAAPSCWYAVGTACSLPGKELLLHLC